MIDFEKVLGRSFLYRAIYHRVLLYDPALQVVTLQQLEPDWNGGFNPNPFEMALADFERHWYDDGGDA